jgi:hypothetical protein
MTDRTPTSFQLSVGPAPPARTSHPTVILEGFLKKLGRLFNGGKIRWVRILSDFTLLSCADRGGEATKSYDLRDCAVQWGQLASKEHAVRIECMRSSSSKKRNLTFIVDSVPVMQRWVGALRCLFASTDALLCNETSIGGSTCTICIRDYEEGDTLSVLPCDHRFCPECIERWLQLSSLCPVCRATATVHGSPLVRRGKWSTGGGGAGESKR